MAPSRPTQTILLVEDDPNDVFLFERALRYANINKRLQVVVDGETVLRYLQGQDEFADRKAFPFPSLIFLDLKLPGMAGFEVLSWIKQQPRFRRLQVVVLTGSPLTIDIYRAYELGADAYLVKPINSDTLVALPKTVGDAWLSVANKTSAKSLWEETSLPPAVYGAADL